MTDTQLSSYRLGYRGDIEGLRALAILLVVAAHAGVPWFAGGFVGVDVFFVLSGYLITGLLVQEIDTDGELRFAAFYARRLRRLMPALLLMLLLVCLFTWSWFPPFAQLDQAKAAGGTAVWLSNFYFAFSDLNYFSPDARSNLFLHTWSLGVEEQFYLAWPLLIVLATGAWQGARRAPRAANLKIVMPAIFILSLILSLWWTGNSPRLAFYMMPSRAWQFALGALVFVYFGAPRVLGELRVRSMLAGDFPVALAGWLGVGAILLAAVWFDDRVSYPGWRALLPSLGTALVLAAGTRSTGVGAGKLLSSRVMQGIGRVSYSWYLWHWPVILLGVAVLGLGSGLQRLALVLVSLVLAVGSYRFVEAPIRRVRGLMLRPGITVLTGLAIMAIASVLSVKWFDYGLEQMRSPDEARYVAASWDAPVIYNMGCDDWYYSARVNVCAFGDKSGAHTAVLFGDSVGAQWFPAIREIFNKPGWRLLVLTKSACPMVDRPVFYSRINRVYAICSIWREQVLRKLADIRPDIVILGSTYSYDYTRSQWTSGTRDVLSQISPYTKKVYVLRSTPVLPFNGPRCLAPRGWLYQLLASRSTCEAPAHDKQFDQVYRWQEAAASHFSNVRMVDMTDVICPDSRCQAQRNGTIIFRDDQHLTATFVKSLDSQMARIFAESTAPEKQPVRSSGR